jgi:hypothetical protein
LRNKTDDEKRAYDNEQLVLKQITVHPEGLGFNELAKILKDDMAPGTLRKILDKLEEKHFIKDKSLLTYRQGQKQIYISTNGYQEYLSYLKTFDTDTEKLIQKLQTFKINDDNTAMEYNKINSFICNRYSIAYLFASINSWETGWAYNEETMKEFLFRFYESYLAVLMACKEVLSNSENKAYWIKFQNNRMKLQQEKEEKHPEIAAILDDREMMYLGQFKTPSETLKKFKQPFE